MSDRRRLLLSPLWFIVALVSTLGLNASSAAAGSATETRVRALEHVTVNSVGQQSSERPASVGCVRPETADLASGSCVATNTANGGAATVRVGQAGEAAVRGAYDIGPKATAVVNGRARIFDGLNGVAVTEVKNVGYQAYTQQLKDSLAYAQQNGLQFDLFVRGGASPTVLSGPLQDAIVSTPGFNVRFIP